MWPSDVFESDLILEGGANPQNLNGLALDSIQNPVHVSVTTHEAFTDIRIRKRRNFAQWPETAIRPETLESLEQNGSPALRRHSPGSSLDECEQDVDVGVRES